MPDIAKETHSLSDFTRNSAEVVKHLKDTGEPVVLTVNGKAEVVVQSAEAYRRLAALAEKAEMMECLEESRKDVEAGRTVPAREALEQLGRKYNLNRRGK